MSKIMFNVYISYIHCCKVLNFTKSPKIVHFQNDLTYYDPFRETFPLEKNENLRKKKYIWILTIKGTGKDDWMIPLLFCNPPDPR